MKTQRGIRLFVALILVLLVILFSILFFAPPKFNDSKIIDTVVNVIDGDTFEYYNENNERQTIRLLCVDTPEKNDFGYEEAKLFLESLILSKQVELKASVTDKDAYNRLLRYVYINSTGDEKILVNKLILNENYGQLLVIPPETCEEMN